MNTVTVTAPANAQCGLYSGYPDSRDFSSIDPKNAISATKVTISGETAKFYYENVEEGVYHCAATMQGHNSICRMVVVNKPETMVEMKLDKLAGNGYEAGFAMLYTTEFEKIALQSEPDLWGSEYAKLFCTPQFASGRPGRHQQTTNQEMYDFIQLLSQKSNCMHIFSLGKSPKYGFDMPLVLFTREPIKNLTLEQAANTIRENGKPTIQYIAQCHSTEPASAEGALAMMASLCGDFEKVLDSLDIYIIPRVNLDGAFDVKRVSPTTNEDMNRDYLFMHNVELRMLNSAFNMFRPQVCIDGHESYHRALTKGSHICADVEVQTGTGSLNHPAEMTKLVVKMAKAGLQKARDLGLRCHFFSKLASAAGGAAGSSYYGTRNCLSFLIETAGQVTMGMTAMERRVLSQYVIASTIVEYVENNPNEILTTVKNSREYMKKIGSIYDENDQFVLAAEVTDTGTWSTPLLDTATGQVVNPDYEAPYQEQTRAILTRSRPTAYVIPKGLSTESEILRVVGNHALEYYQIPENTTLLLQQYKNTENGIEVGEETPVFFENGAIVFPNTADSAILCVIMEPDFSPANPDRKMTLLRMELISGDSDGFLPLYRHCHNLSDGKIVLD